VNHRQARRQAVLACVILVTALCALPGCTASGTQPPPQVEIPAAARASFEGTVALSRAEVAVGESVVASFAVSNVTGQPVSVPNSEPIVIVAQNDERIYVFSLPGGGRVPGDRTVRPGERLMNSIKFEIPVAGSYRITTAWNSASVTSTPVLLLVK